MKTEEYLEYIKRNTNLTIFGEAAMGTISEFPVIFSVDGSIPCLSIYLNPKDISKVSKSLSDGLKNLGAKVETNNNGELKIKFSKKVQSVEFNDHYTNVTRTVFSVMQGTMVRPDKKCPICGLENCDYIGIADAKCAYVHKRCMEGEFRNVKAMADENQTGGSYALGIIGGILGGLLACIPSVLTIWFAETIWAVLYALIPLGVYYGYKILKGKMSKAVLPITIIISAIMAVLIDIINLGMVIIADGLSLSILPYLLADSQFLEAMLPEFAKSLLFVAIGIAIVWNLIKRNNYTLVDNMASSLTTLVPIDFSQSENNDAGQAYNGYGQTSDNSAPTGQTVQSTYSQEEPDTDSQEEDHDAYMHENDNSYMSDE